MKMGNNKLNILCLLDFFSYFGGTEYVNYNLIAGLKELGHDITVCVCERLSFGTWAEMLRDIGVEMIVSEHPYDSSNSLDNQFGFITNFVDKLIEEKKPDVIFAHPPGKLLIAYLKLHPQSDIPVLAMEYTVPSENTKYWYHPELTSVQSRITAYIAKCDEAEEGLRNYYGYTGKIYRLPNIVAKAPKPDESVSGELLSVGCVARLSPEKGIGFLLGAWKLVTEKQPDAHLHIYGHGLHGEYYQLLTDNLGIRPYVTFEGTFHPVTGIDDIAAKHKIFVQPSLFESIPNSLIELALRKKAIVATDAGGIPELIRPDKNEGVLVKAGSTDMLAEAVLRLMNDEELTETIAENAYTHAAEIYDYDKTIQRYEDVLKELISGGAV